MPSDKYMYVMLSTDKHVCHRTSICMPSDKYVYPMMPSDTYMNAILPSNTYICVMMPSSSLYATGRVYACHKEIIFMPWCHQTRLCAIRQVCMPSDKYVWYQTSMYVIRQVCTPSDKYVCHQTSMHASGQVCTPAAKYVRQRTSTFERIRLVCLKRTTINLYIVFKKKTQVSFKYILFAFFRSLHIIGSVYF